MKNLFRTLKRLHFWIICPLVAVMGLVGWWMATKTIQDVTRSRVGAIESQFRDLQNISSKQPHPNSNVEAGMERLTDARRDEVAEAWNKKYEQQLKGDVMNWDLDWPAEKKDRFVKVVKDLRPIEKTVDYPAENEPIVVVLRHYYRDYIAKELPRLARTIRAEWNPSTGRGGRGGPMTPRSFQDEADEFGGQASRNGERTNEEEVQIIVDWNPANQLEILNTHFTWDDKPGYGFQGDGTAAPTAERPTTLDVLYAQEDFWVLQAIMNVIDRTNRDPNNPEQPVTTSVNATVKAIDYIRIGANASLPQGKVKRGGLQNVPGGIEEQRMMGPPPSMGDEFRGAAGGMGGPDPAEGRYVDNNYQALPAATLRSVMASEDAVAPESVYLAVAKRMPVRMGLKVDQRRLNQLLQECASSELTIEVRQVRVNPSGEASQLGGRQGIRAEFSGAPVRGRSAMAADAFSYDIDVELYGIIYIYNPVDRKILGYEDEESTEGETSDDQVAAK